MKKQIVHITLSVSVLLLSLFSNTLKAQPAAAVSFQVFYDNLSPYGQWINDPAYGFVWVPEVDNDFRPYYTNGYWVMTEFGNTWVSSYPWGWAPFHYGRWTFDSFYGWVWIPGMEWSPSWVCWRWGGGYYGWAPLSPGIMVSISFSSYYCPENWWIFIPPYYLHHPGFHQHVYGPRKSITIINSTTIINNVYVRDNATFFTGPRTSDIKNETNQDVETYRLEPENKPGETRIESKTIRIYQPAISEEKAAPAKVNRAPRPIEQPREFQPRTNERTNQPMPGRPADRAENDRPIRVEPQQPVERPRWNMPERRPVQQPQSPRNIDRSRTPERQPVQQNREIERPRQAPAQQQQSSKEAQQRR